MLRTTTHDYYEVFCFSPDFGLVSVKQLRLQLYETYRQLMICMVITLVLRIKLAWRISSGQAFFIGQEAYFKEKGEYIINEY